MTVYNDDADLDVSDTCVRNSLLSELSRTESRSTVVVAQKDTLELHSGFRSGKSRKRRIHVGAYHHFLRIIMTSTLRILPGSENTWRDRAGLARFGRFCWSLE